MGNEADGSVRAKVILKGMTMPRNEKVYNAVQTILNELNGGNRVSIAGTIYDAVTSDHRTLQQSFWSVIIMAFCAYAKNSFDLRNEESVRFAEQTRVIAAERNFDIAGFPYI